MGPTWDSPGIYMGPTWAPNGQFGPQMGYLGPKWAIWAPNGLLGIHLGSTWAPLGPHLGPTWVPIGSKWGPSGQPTYISFGFSKFQYVMITYSNRLESLLTTCNKMVRMVTPFHLIITSLLNASDCDMVIIVQFICISRLSVYISTALQIINHFQK